MAGRLAGGLSVATFTFQFQSRHAGYGDRTGQVPAQVTTNHEARIIVDHGEVTHAVLDNTWYMLARSILDQRRIPSPIWQGKPEGLPDQEEAPCKRPPLAV